MMQSTTSNRNRIALAVWVVAVIATFVVGGGAVGGAGATEDPTPSQPPTTPGAATSPVVPTPPAETPPTSQPQVTAAPPPTELPPWLENCFDDAECNEENVRRVIEEFGPPPPAGACWSPVSPWMCDEEWTRRALASGEIVLQGAERLPVATGGPVAARAPAAIRVTG